MGAGRIFWSGVVLTGLILAGCSDPPELAAAKKISSKVAQARELMKDRSAGSYERAKALLREALATQGATSISKQGAHELMGALLSMMTAQELLGLGEERASFDDADANLQRSLSELSRKASALAYTAGLVNSNHDELQRSREKLKGQIPQARRALSRAVEVRTALAEKLQATEKAAFAAAAKADDMLLEAAKASADEQVSKVREGSAKRLDADKLLIAASVEELALTRAKEDEIRAESALAELEESLASVTRMIDTHASLARKTSVDKQSAHAKADESAGKVVEGVKAFKDLGTKLSQGYDELIKGQSEAAKHCEQALRGAVELGGRFRKFKKDQPPEADDDERVDMLAAMDAEISLAVSVARAKITLAGLREEKAEVLEQALARIRQMREVRADLALIGDERTPGEIDEDESQPDMTGAGQREQGALEFFGKLLSRSERAQQEADDKQEQFSAAGVVMNLPRIDTRAIMVSIQASREAAVEDLNSAVKTLQRTAAPRMKAESQPEAVVERLERAKWNWQVLGMLGLSHQARGRIAGRMGQEELAMKDAAGAATYLAASNKARAGVLRSIESN